MGLSGGGKTTVLRAVAALEPFDAGTIDVGGVVLRPGRAAVARRRCASCGGSVGMVFQLHYLFEHLTALDNVTLAPMHVARVAARRRRVSAALDAARVARRRASPQRLSARALRRRGAARGHRPRHGHGPAAAADGRADRLARPGPPLRARRDAARADQRRPHARSSPPTTTTSPATSPPASSSWPKARSSRKATRARC